MNNDDIIKKYNQKYTHYGANESAINRLRDIELMNEARADERALILGDFKGKSRLALQMHIKLKVLEERSRIRNILEKRIQYYLNNRTHDTTIKLFEDVLSELDEVE